MLLKIKTNKLIKCIYFYHVNSKFSVQSEELIKHSLISKLYHDAIETLCYKHTACITNVHSTI